VSETIKVDAERHHSEFRDVGALSGLALDTGAFAILVNYSSISTVTDARSIDHHVANMYVNLYKPGRQTRWAVTFACQLAFILFGYDQGVFSGIIGNEDFVNVMKNPNDSLLGIIVSIYNLGCFTGCIINFFIGDWLGRRKAMWLAMAWIIVGLLGAMVTVALNEWES